MNAEPWFAEWAQDWLEEQIQPDWTAFEWGSGGSTLWLEGLCASVVSVEHDPAWWDRVQQAVDNALVTVMLVHAGGEELGSDPANPRHYRSSCRPGNFRDYVQVIDLMEPFDLVMVDGRARASCIAHAVPMVRKGGVLVLDNAERDWYLAQTRNLLDGWERTDFWEGEWLTSAWMKK